MGISSIPILVWDNGKLRQASQDDAIICGKLLSITDATVSPENDVLGTHYVHILIAGDLFRLLLAEAS